MYTPKAYQLNDLPEAVNFMRRYSFGTLVSAHNGIPIATHLPFVIKLDGENVILSSHIARINEQADDLLAGNLLVIFSEPHAYISPSHYEKELNVPTWNYIAVHAYGHATILAEETKQIESLEEMISSYDAGYLKQWAQLPMEYKSRMCKGIVVFDIDVTDLQGKKKLSQNRSVSDQQSIINAFTQSSDINERTISDYMKQELHNSNKI